VITHENTREDRVDTYLAEALQPCTPLLVFGRAAKASPGCPNQQAVYDWWKDLLRVSDNTLPLFLRCQVSLPPPDDPFLVLFFGIRPPVEAYVPSPRMLDCP